MYGVKLMIYYKSSIVSDGICMFLSKKMKVLNKNQGWHDSLILSDGSLEIKIYNNVIPV
ncbi:hypothetical protein SAMN05216524_107343 [Mucilaginibacter sp. OK098]|nr:hypothetical protein SAMN05216524_107343 [Mucilaginibacter sp. OK098]